MGDIYSKTALCVGSTSSKSGDAGHFFVNPNTNSYSSFSSCCNGGSIIDFLMEYNRLDKKEAIDRAKSIAGIQRSGGNNQMNNNTRSQNNNEIKQQREEEKKKQEEAEKQRIEYLKQQKGQFIKNALERQTEENKQKVYEYMESRNISKETANRYHLFISNNIYEDKDHLERVVIPIYENNEPISYVARATSKEIQGQAKALNSAGEQTPLNIDYIKQEPGENNLIYVCEAWADALSFEDIGEKAIALHSTQKVNQFLIKITDNIKTASKYHYVLCCDNDEAGIKANAKLAEEFNNLQIKYSRMYIPKEYNDINEWYCKVGSQEVFKAEINPLKDDNVLRYIDNSFLNDIERMKTYKSKSTGFKNLDKEINGVYPGLYVLGAISSLGKTTFISQLVDQMAQQGEHVIFFSLEQSRFELVAKGISRQTFILNPQEAKTSLAIMQNTDIADITIKGVEQYQPIAHNTNIVEGNFNITVNSIREYVGEYIKFCKVKPIVVLDYLQILRPLNDRLTDKQQVDYNVTELKRISRDYDIPVFVICSFNRDNYTTTVDFTSFKESGAIEYSADVVMGLQLAVMEEIKGNAKLTEVREKINEAKNEIPRKIQLIGLKNRNGKSYFKCNYKFYSAFNYFEEADTTTLNTPTYRPRNRQMSSYDNSMALPF